jgi:hypothetical protein
MKFFAQVQNTRITCVAQEIYENQFKDIEFMFQIPEQIAMKYLDYYYKDGTFKKYPDKPSEYHSWNPVLETWEEPENYQQLLFDEAASKVKQKRQQLLTATDWTDTVSASTRLGNYNTWQFYRQELRDITKQEGYPFNIIWPTQPS